MRYRELSSAEIPTIETLERRVGERFPDSGLRKLCLELQSVARDAQRRVETIAEPNRPLRIGVGLLITAVLAIVFSALLSLHLPATVNDFGSFAQALDAGINDVIFLGIAIFFLVSLERRIKRRRDAPRLARVTASRTLWTCIYSRRAPSARA